MSPINQPPDPLWYKTIIQYKTPIASLLTLIVTLFMSHFLRYFGKMRFLVSKIEKETGYGENELKGKVYFRVNFLLDIYNGADVPKSLRGLNFELNLKEDEAKKSSFTCRDITDTQVAYLNIPPKSIVKISCFGSAGSINPKKVNSVKIYFTARGPWIKKYKEKITTINIKEIGAHP